MDKGDGRRLPLDQALAWSSDLSLHRVGVIDVGSNSIRLVVFDGVARSPAYYFSEKVSCGLGSDLARTGLLSPEGRERAMAALRRFTAVARRAGTSALIAVATAAVREAEDGPAFAEEVKAALGLHLWIATGPEEARLAGQGVLLGWPHATGVVCDIGGASMELAALESAVFGAQQTLPLGPQKLVLMADDAKARAQVIEAELAKVRALFPQTTRKLFLVGGSWRALARLDMYRRDWPLPVLHEYSALPDQLIKTCRWVADQSPDDLKKTEADISGSRLPLLPVAAEVLAGVLEALEPEGVVISSYGLREGLLYQMMPASLRAKDPLIEACRHLEATHARKPGFGDALMDWIAPLFPDLSPERTRLYHAACLLHDNAWRQHPQDRAELCFDAVVRANLGGLDHSGRVFLAATVMHRYKAPRKMLAAHPIIPLLDADHMAEAEILGRALRFGAMITGGDAELLSDTWLSLNEETLYLNVGLRAAAFDGEVPRRRLSSLAQRLNRKGEVRFDPRLI